MEDRLEPPVTCEQYITIFRPKRWADECAFRGAGKLLGINLVVVEGPLSAPNRVIPYTTIFLHYEAGHYKWLQALKEVMPAYIAQKF